MRSSISGRTPPRRSTTRISPRSSDGQSNVGEADRGVVICGSGVGAAVAANKMVGVRAGLCHDTYSARQCVEHDDVNVLSLGGRVIGPEVAVEVVHAFLAAKFTGEERHMRRLNKILAIERSEASRKQGA